MHLLLFLLLRSARVERCVGRGRRDCLPLLFLLKEGEEVKGVLWFNVMEKGRVKARKHKNKQNQKGINT